MNLPRRLGLSAIILALISLPSRAELIVDQSFPPPDPPPAGQYFGINLDNSVFPTSLIGQSFTPTFSGIDAIAFFLQDDEPSDGRGGSFFVELMTGDLSTILATSGTVALGDGFGAGATFDDPKNVTGSEALFVFGSTVALTPGEIYAAVLRKEEGGRFLVRGRPTDGYLGGRYLGSSDPNNDLFFREGSLIRAIPEPPGILLSGLGLGAVALAVGLSRAVLRRPGEGRAGGPTIS
ncbi:hypothetical protein [Tautonia plasticadhaerens]|uniref:PEP-CTERM protein-sorting domain-containing protein n=1 Tax=Tautonia plasticadhaerens TaxID=2527974 RepID=A0A518GVU5_9BACT|nr:hypothetical protein [Tautonia plasticadhaerens]QDV32720.1 hypothetical protein ElP_05600 [Tautonia plasticadhaerens]